MRLIVGAFLAMQVPPFSPREGLISFLGNRQDIDNYVTFLNTVGNFGSANSPLPQVLQKQWRRTFCRRQFPLGTDSRRRSGVSSQNGLGHGEK